MQNLISQLKENIENTNSKYIDKKVNSRFLDTQTLNKFKHLQTHTNFIN